MGLPLPVPETQSTRPNLTLSIFLISVVGLFLELLLIRWVGTEVRLFAYLQTPFSWSASWAWGWAASPVASRPPCATFSCPCSS